MRKFDLTTLEGYEAYLNHGDSERVRLREESDMTKPEHPVVEALERIVQNHSMYCEYHVGVSSHAYELAGIAEKVLPLARELVEYKEGLEWIIGHWTADMSLIVKCSQDAPAIIKRMIGEKT